MSDNQTIPTVDILPGNIQYLSFEGGGAKGVTYMGAFLAMLHPSFQIFANDPTTGYKILNRSKIEGISGASAGAITAALLASGVSLEEIGIALVVDKLMDKVNDFTKKDLGTAKFIDITAPWQLYGERERSRNILVDLLIKAGAPFLLKLGLVVGYPVLDNLLHDYGLVPGVVIRKNLDVLLTAGLSRMKGKKIDPGITFYQHFILTKTELVLTAVNLSRRQFFYLSFKTTPNLKVADAIRMSMAIPGYFKPVHVTKEQLNKGSYTTFERQILEGYWVDGGLINNNPIHAFDVDNKGLRLDTYKLANINKNLLGIRLGREPKTILKVPGIKDLSPTTSMEVNNFIAPKSPKEYFLTIMGTVIDNSSELQFTSPNQRQQVIDLITGFGKKEEIGVTDFDADPMLVKKVVNQAAIDTLTAFKIPLAQNPMKDESQWSTYSVGLRNVLTILKT